MNTYRKNVMRDDKTYKQRENYPTGAKECGNPDACLCPDCREWRKKKYGSSERKVKYEVD